MTRDDLIKYWTLPRLRRWSKQSVEALGLPPDQASFLSSVGLPDLHEWPWEFGEQYNDLPKHPRVPSLRIVGVDGPTPICVNLQHQGEVVAVEEDSAESPRFVNSSVEAFATFLTLFHRNADDRDPADDSRVALLLKDEFSAVDPPALRDLTCYWPHILAQVRDGLL